MSHTVVEPPKDAAGVSLSCATCREDVPSDEFHCPNCFTPVEVSRTIAERDRAAQFVSVLGASGAGKTVYLGMLLDMLTKGGGGLRGVVSGAFSVAVQQQTVLALERQRFPEKTSSEADLWQWVHCEVSRRDRPKEAFDLVTPDLAGEAVSHQIQDPDSFKTVQHVVRRSQGLILLVDSVRARDAGREQDCFAIKLASYLKILHSRDERARRGKVTTPLAVVLTKADACPEAREDPRGFAETQLPGLVQTCGQGFAAHEYFTCGVVGSCGVVIEPSGATRNVPLHVAPHGVLEPLEWIAKRL